MELEVTLRNGTGRIWSAKLIAKDILVGQEEYFQKYLHKFDSVVPYEETPDGCYEVDLLVADSRRTFPVVFEKGRSLPLDV